MWPRRVIVADAHRHRVPILPVDVNHSRPGHTVEQTDDGTWGVRLALSAVRGITEEECARIDAGRPYTSLTDLWQRARPALPTAEHLARISALDHLHDGQLTRWDLLLHLPELHRRTRTVGDGQLPLDDPRLDATQPSGLPEMSVRESVGAELHVLGIDVTRHLMEHHHRLLRELGAVDARHLAHLRPGQQVLVAGVRASTQTPPIAPSGRRVIFVSLEDGSGLVDVAFFEDSHPACAATVFHSGLLLVRGKVQLRGRRRTVVAFMAWDLDEIAAARRDHGPQAALDLLGAPTTQPTPAQPRRVLVHHTGARQHPYADLPSPGRRSADLSRLGHRSPGSPG